MNKTAIKNFAIWARNKLIADMTYKAGLMGITQEGIQAALPQSAKGTEFYDIGMPEPYAVSGNAVEQRKRLVALINQKAVTTDFKTAYRFVIEEVAYTWFNRLIAIRFMEVNDYLPSHIRVLSSESDTKMEPDLVTTPFDADLELTETEKAEIVRLKHENQADELFRMLFIKQCNALNAILPKLFENTEDYSELLLNVSVTDKDGVVYRLAHDIEEADWMDAVQIIGWLYQYYNNERKNEVINIYKGTISQEDIPAATQLFTTDWVVRYMVDNSLGRYWIERNPQSKLAEKLDFFATPKDGHIQYVDEKIAPSELTFFDPCMGSGHILVYAFDVLMEIYNECGFADRDAAESILKHNLFGLDIDSRAYQLAYFAVMMRARYYDRRMLNKGIYPNVYPVYESNECHVRNQDLQYLMDEFRGTQQYGSLINLKREINLNSLQQELDNIQGQLAVGMVDIDAANNVIKIAHILTRKYCVVCTNPPYLNKMNPQLKDYILANYKDYCGDLFSVFMYKNFDYCKRGGYSAFMTPFVWMFIKTYEKLRAFIVDQKSITTLVQMEYSAFDEAIVPICSFVLKNANSTEKGLYFKLSDFKGGMDIQKKKVLEAIARKNCGYFYETAEENFYLIPGMPIAYWVYKGILNAFSNGRELEKLAEIVTGMSTGDNNRYLREWTEVNFNTVAIYQSNIDNVDLERTYWIPYNKGGDARKWYGNNEYVVNWNEADNFHRPRPSFKHLYLQQGITWSFVTSGMFSARYYPDGFLWDVAGSPCIIKNESRMYYVLGFLSTKLADLILKIINPTINCQVADIQRIPIIENKHLEESVTIVAKASIILSKIDWDSFETSWDFQIHPLLHHSVSAAYDITESDMPHWFLKNNYKLWEAKCQQQFNQLKSNEEELNRIFIHIYGLQDELTPEVEDKDITVRKADLGRDIRSLISYAVGCMFGRYSLDVPGLAYAGGEWDANRYTTFIPDQDNVLPITDEEYFEDDIVGLFCAWLEKVYGEDTLKDNLEFIAKALGNKGNTPKEVIRSYFLNDFFCNHCRIYQKRPIYWLFDSGKQNGFKALIYMHRYDENTIGNLRIDYLHRMERVYESEIARMQDVVDNSTNAHEAATATKRKEKLQKQLKECREYDEKIAHLALARIAIDLDDGVKVNYEKVQIGLDGKMYEVLARI